MPPTLFGDCCLVCGNIFSIFTLLGELAYGYSQPSSTVHTTGGMEPYSIVSVLRDLNPVTTTMHHWWKGNIYSIVTVLGDLAPGDSHPSYTTVYTIDDVHLLYRGV